MTQQITMEYAGKNVPSEARGTWKCPWNLPTLVINKYFKQRAVTALKIWKNTTAYAKTNLDVLTQQTAMACAKNYIAHITRNPLDISTCLKLPFLLYMYRTLVTTRLHTG